MSNHLASCVDRNLAYLILLFIFINFISTRNKNDEENVTVDIMHISQWMIFIFQHLAAESNWDLNEFICLKPWSGWQSLWDVLLQ